MEKINELIDKYFRGETSLSEEHLLKDYFRSGIVLPEHQHLQPLFKTFESESSEKYSKTSVDFSQIHQVKVKRIWLQVLSYSSVAAAIAVLFWFVKLQPADDYAIVNGRKIENQEYAQKIAQSKINKINKLLAKGMEPMQKINKVKEGLQPIEKVSETRQKLKEISNVIQFK